MQACKKKLISACLLLALATYVALYAAAYTFARPAGNMLYFVYPELGVSEKTAYTFSPPAYSIHKGVCSVTRIRFGKHNLDRPEQDVSELGGV